MSLPNTIIIPHGMTEVRFVQWLLSELKTRAIIYRPYGKSERMVSMKEIGGILSSAPFTTVQKMHKAFEELEYDRRTGLRDVKAIPILDVDADRRSLGMYKSCDMFDSFCLGKENVIPVYNDPNIEAVIERRDTARWPITWGSSRNSWIPRISMNSGSVCVHVTQQTWR